VRRSDEVMALGFPLGQQSLKSTTGVVSGYEAHMIQISAAINPGSSGGPLINERGEVVGINTAAVTEAQNVGYAIPTNTLKIVLESLKSTKLVRKPFLGVLYNNASEALAEYLHNPEPGGCFVVEVVKGSALDKAGVCRGDMIYAINGNSVDMYGEMRMPWSEYKISIIDYVSRLSVGERVRILGYRKGERKEFTVVVGDSELPAIRKVFPLYEPLDYEVFAGMVVMELTLNHVHALINNIPGLSKYAQMKHQGEPVLLITHIFPTSYLYRNRTITIGATINEVNNHEVKTLADLRVALRDRRHRPASAARILTRRQFPPAN
jgi:S1-C subfamily serine protease